MPVDPILEPLLASLPPFPEEIADWNALRAQENGAGEALIEQLAEPGPQVRERRTVAVPVEGGEIALNVYLPEGEDPHPAHVYLHGGGWVGGTIHSTATDILCRERCAGADCVVVAVEYRKAPEHPFPTGLEDSYAALLWVVEHADELGIRPDLVTIGGGSAGANLAAAVALKVRDEGGPALALQLLEVPAVDLTLASPSMQRHAEGYGLTLSSIQQLLTYYLPSPDAATHPHASPLLAPDLSGLPPAYILSAEYDPLCDDGQRYAQQLHQAGVPTHFSLQTGQIHISSALTKILPAARAWREEVLAVLQRVHAGGSVTDESLETG